LAGGGFAEEEPVFLADGGGADGVFDQVVVDLQTTILEEDQQCGPLIEGVVDGFAHEALRQVTTDGFQSHQGTMQPSQHRSAPAGSLGLSSSGTGPRLAQLCLQLV